MQLIHKIQGFQVPEGSVAVFWLGQAGFYIKTHMGKKILIDPYLSDCCMRYFGFKRLMPYILTPDEADADILITSHAHFDHFDVDSVPRLMSCEKTVLFAANDVKEECGRLHIPEERVTYLSVGERQEADGIEIFALPCDHGELAPDALGLLLKIDGKKIYFTGDTAFRQDLFANPAVKGCDLLIVPINGAFGNMNESEAQEAASIIAPKRVVPCHFWNFAEHGGNPGLFAQSMDANAPHIPYSILPVGGEILI